MWWVESIKVIWRSISAHREPHALTPVSVAYVFCEGNADRLTTDLVSRRLDGQSLRKGMYNEFRERDMPPMALSDVIAILSCTSGRVMLDLGLGSCLKVITGPVFAP